MVVQIQQPSQFYTKTSVQNRPTPTPQTYVRNGTPQWTQRDNPEGHSKYGKPNVLQTRTHVKHITWPSEIGPLTKDVVTLTRSYGGV